MMRRTSFWGVLEGLVGLHSESESDVAQSCLTLCDPMDCSLPGSSLHGILQVGLRAAAAAAKSLLSCDPIDGSPPGSAVPGILQARTLECVAISFSNA